MHFRKLCLLALLVLAVSFAPSSNYRKYDVGAVSESCQVNPNGSSSVNVEIELPESPYGFQPKLSLCYNSMYITGDMGWGWSISGSSCIAETDRNFYFDGTVESSNCLAADSAVFTLDGTRLIKTASSANTICYETVKGQILATAYLNHDTVSYFKVRYPNGNIGYFRNCYEGKYYLSEAVDPRNQHIYYSYTSTEQGLLLTDIHYAKNRYHIKLNYGKTTEVSDVVFCHGTRHAYSRLLSDIEIYIHSNLWKKYTVNYAKSHRTNQVSSIGCENGEGKMLPPLEFSYGNSEPLSRTFSTVGGQLSSYFPFENASDIVVQKGKFRYGSANEGMVMYPNYLSNLECWRHKTAFRHSEHYFTNQYPESQEIIVANNLNDSISFACGKLTAGKGFNGIVCADIDKNPGEEIIKFNEYLEGEEDQTEITACSPSTYGGLVQKYHFKKSFNTQYKDPNGHSSVYPKNFYVGDFNGDGTNEVLAIMPSNLFDSGNAASLYLIDVVSNKVLYQKEAPFFYNVQYCKYNTGDETETVSAKDAARNSDQLFVLDIDEDEKSEIVHIGEDGTATYSFEFRDSSFVSCRQIYLDSSLKKEHTLNRQVYLAQLNSDNLPDIVIAPGEDKYQWCAYLSMGNGKFFRQTVTYPYAYNSDKTYLFQDINLDGKSDLVEYQNGSEYIRAFLTGENMNTDETITSTIEKNSIVTSYNVSGRDWTSNLMTVNNKGVVKKYIFQDNDFNERLLSSYTNSFGVVKQFTYRNLYHSDYITGYNADFPFANYRGALLMVANHKEISRQKTLADTDYQYSNAVIHRQGLGFRGYEYIYTADKVSGESTRTKYDVFHDGKILEASDARQSVIYEYTDNIQSDKIDKSVLKKTTTVDNATGVTMTEEMEYDNFLNVSRRTTSFEYNSNGLVSVKTGEDGLLQSFEYDKWDRMVGSEDYKGKTSLEYDGWGDLVSSTKSDGTKSCRQTSWSDGEAGSVYKAETSQTGMPNTISFYNELGQTVREGSCHFDGAYLFVDKEYDEKGRVFSVSLPYKQTKPSNKYSYSYDKFGRPVSAESPVGCTTSYSYNGLDVTTTENGKSVKKSYNVFNDLKSVDSYKGSISYQYDGNGNVTEETTRGVTRKYKYDSYGRLISQTEPHTGTRGKSYNEEGQVAEDNNGEKSISYTYDNLGRITAKNVEDKQTFSYNYNTYGELVSVTSNDGKLTKKISYDEMHRLHSIEEQNNGKTLTQTFQYDNGRISTVSYQSDNGLSATENYSYRNGVLTEIKLNGNKTIWHLDAENEQGKATAYSSLGYNTKYEYDAASQLSSIAVSREDSLLWRENYDFDPVSGNLMSRSNLHGLEEQFAYDEMDRLVSVNGNKIAYDEIGNITDNAQVGSYTYNDSRPYELDNITTRLAELPQAGQKIAYNSTLQPVQIEDNKHTATFQYGEDGQRILMEIYGSNGEMEKQKYYFGNKYELTETSGGIIERLYLGGDAYNAPVVLEKDSLEENLYNITRDYQGSIKAIYDEAGNLVQESSFDPWGRMRNPETGEYYPAGEEPVLILDRGYTGHEHLADYQLINMNGRLYNPILGRFLSTDPVLADDTNPQNFNSYAYALNNPLKYADKTGKMPTAVVVGGILLGTYIGGSIANHNFNPTKWDWSSTSTYFGMVLGGGAGAFTVYGAAAGYFGVNVTLATPFVAVGINYATNDHGQGCWNGGYTTIAGGGYSYGENIAENNAGKVYNRTVATMRNVYNSIADDLSNFSISDFSDTWLESCNEWSRQNITITNRNISNKYFYDETVTAPGDISEIKSIRYGKNILNYGTKFNNVYSTLETIFSSGEIFFDENLTARNKGVDICSNIGGLIGGFVLSSCLTLATAETGIGAIAAAAIGFYAGNKVFSYVGGFVGGVCYDIYQVYSFYKNIQNISNYSNKFQKYIH